MRKLLIDSSGINGIHGISGVSLDASETGHGLPGHNATHPTHGTSGGVIDLSIGYAKDTATPSIDMFGQFCSPKTGNQNQLFNGSYPLHEITLFELKAGGGYGGNGGNGGDGQNGASGHRGRDATRHECGTDGGRGFDGGDAGAGTSGANGGPGGSVTLRTFDTDAGLLLMFVDSWTPTIVYGPNVSGGRGGAAGQHGNPGRGGPGGRGGSPYYWTEIRYRGDYTETITHVVSGGSRGPDGSPGGRQTALLYDATAGTNGVLQFVIENSVTREAVVYNEIFDLRLKHLTSHSVTGVFEPEAQILITNLELSNTSSMPTPKADIRVTVDDNKWIRNRNEYNILPQTIIPRSSMTNYTTQPFSYMLKEHTVDQPGPPLRDTDTLRIRAKMSVLERWLPAFDINGTQVNIQYPIELTRISYMNSMAVGHVCRVRWGIQNTASIDYGALSLCQRVIRVRVGKKSGGIPSSVLKFGLKPTQKETSLTLAQTLENEYIFEIPLLKANQHLELEATLTLGEAELYEAADIWIYLELGRIDSPSSPKVVHINCFDISVSTIYRGFPAGFLPDVLLVANHKTTREEYLAWADLLNQQLGLKFFLWDISQMGHFNLTQPIPSLYSSEPTTLMKDLAGKTMIILDNNFQYGDSGRTVTAQTFAIYHQWSRAIHGNDNRFYVANPQAAKVASLASLNRLAQAPFETWRYNKFKFSRVYEFAKHLLATPDGEQMDEGRKNSNQEVDNKLNGNEASLEPLMDADVTKNMDQIVEVHIRSKMFQGMERRIIAKATKVNKNLKSLRPHIHHLVIYESCSGKEKNDGKTGGSITIVPSLTTTRRRIMFSASDDPKRPIEFVNSTENVRGVIAGLGIDIHFRLLERIFVSGPIDEDAETDDVGLFLSGGNRELTKEEKRLAGILKQLLVYDIAVELATICDGVGHNSSLGDSQIIEMMENLRRLVWKVESLSGTTTLPKQVAEDEQLAAIFEDGEDEDIVSSVDNHLTEHKKSEFDRSKNVDSGDAGSDIDNFSEADNEIIVNAAPEATVIGNAPGDAEAIFYMFPVKHDSALGEWMMDILAQLYAFIKCLRAGFHQNILPNRRAENVEQQAMDLLHRIGEASIIDFADPRSIAKLESLGQEQQVPPCPQEQLGTLKTKDLTSDELMPEQKSPVMAAMEINTSFLAISLGPSSTHSLPDQNLSALSDDFSTGNSHRRARTDYSDSTHLSVPSTNNSHSRSRTDYSSSVASGLSFASGLTSATRSSSTSFSNSGSSASRSRITFKQLDPQRRKTIKSFKEGAKVHLQHLIEKHYKAWMKGANYKLGGFFDPLKTNLRRHAMKCLIFNPSESLVDNTIYGQLTPENYGKKTSEVQNTILSNAEYENRKEEEKNRIKDLDAIVSEFLIFHEKMLQGNDYI